jgi:hypothetical protein
MAVERCERASGGAVWMLHTPRQESGRRAMYLRLVRRWKSGAGAFFFGFGRLLHSADGRLWLWRSGAPITPGSLIGGMGVLLSLLMAGGAAGRPPCWIRIRSGENAIKVIPVALSADGTTLAVGARDDD